MHKAMLKAMRTVNQKQAKPEDMVPRQKTIVAEVVGKSGDALQCPIRTARTYTVTADIRNLQNGYDIRGVEFVIDTGCHFAIVIPAFVADQIGLDDSTLVQVFNVTNADGSVVDAPTHNVLLVINGIPIQTTATVSGTAGEKALIGAELFSLFDLQIRRDSCRLTLIASK